MSNKTKPIGIVVAVLAVLLIGGGLYWFVLRDDAPEEVDLDTAAGSVTSTTAGDGPTSSVTGGDAATTGIDGKWTLDTTTGEFDYESATGTFVGYRVQENLANIGSNTAVGRTNAVEGSMQIDGTKVTSAQFTVDMTQLTSNDDSGFRDRRVQGALGTEEFPTATFELTEPIELGADAASGSEIKVTAKGDLTIHGETKAVEIPLQAKLVDGTVVVVGSLDLKFSDFGVEVPSAPVVVSADDHGVLEMQLLFSRV